MSTLARLASCTVILAPVIRYVEPDWLIVIWPVTSPVRATASCVDDWPANFSVTR